MTIRSTRWSPDTCGCTLEYTWDDTEPEITRVNAISIINRSCEFHRNLLPNMPVTYTCILDENQKKNKSFQIALDNATQQLTDTFTNEDGSTYIVLKNGIAFNYSFSGIAPNRILTIQFIGASLTQNQKNNIQSKLNQVFGTGNVIII